MPFGKPTIKQEAPADVTESLKYQAVYDELNATPIGQYTVIPIENDTDEGLKKDINDVRHAVQRFFGQIPIKCKWYFSTNVIKMGDGKVEMWVRKLDPRPEDGGGIHIKDVNNVGELFSKEDEHYPSGMHPATK